MGELYGRDLQRYNNYYAGFGPRTANIFRKNVVVIKSKMKSYSAARDNDEKIEKELSYHQHVVQPPPLYRTMFLIVQ